MRVAVYAEMPVWIEMDTETGACVRCFTNEHDAENVIVPDDANVFVMGADGWMTGDEIDDDERRAAFVKIATDADKSTLVVIPG